MKKNRQLKNQQTEIFIPPTPSILSPLHKLSLPLTLHEYYLPYLENVKDCLLFLERFSEEDEAISKLLKVYKTDPEFKNKLDLDLDLLAFRADLSKGEFRRLINSTLDLLGDEEAMMLLKVNKPSIVAKSLQVALTHDHPDSMQERKSFMEYFGYRLAPKNNQVLVNIDKSTNTTQQLAISGLPSFSNQIHQSEKLAQAEIQSMLNKDDKGQKQTKQIENPNLIPIYSDEEKVQEAEFVNLNLDDIKEKEEDD